MGLRTALGLKKSGKRKRARFSLFPKRSLGTLQRYCESLRGRDCIVLGSAPDPMLEHSGEPIICCNGSPVTLRRMTGRAPDYTFIHSHKLGRQNATDIEGRDALSGIGELGRVVVFDEARYANGREILEHRATAVTVFDWDRRYDIIDSLIGSPLRILETSTGAMTVATVLLAGAKSVRLVGFSFDRKGHSYSGSGHRRPHVRSDAALFALLAQSGFDIRSSEPSVAMILAKNFE